MADARKCKEQADVAVVLRLHPAIELLAMTKMIRLWNRPNPQNPESGAGQQEGAPELLKEIQEPEINGIDRPLLQ
jgi:hypothetical protein